MEGLLDTDYFLLVLVVVEQGSQKELTRRSAHYLWEVLEEDKTLAVL
jgi:hypothetical protein